MLFLEPNGDWHRWQDSEGNRLTIFKDNSVQVYPAKDRSISTKDIFRKASPNLIIKHSYWGIIITEKNKDILILLGNDGKLRSSYFENNIWIENISPLLLGFHILRYISYGYLESDVRKIKLLNVIYPKEFKIEEAWAFGIPIEDTIINKKVSQLLI